MRPAQILVALALICSQSLAQEPDGWRRNDIGRSKVLIGPKEEGEEIPTFLVTWQSPAVYGETISVMRHHGKILGTNREEYRIVGVENDALKLQLTESAQHPPEKGLKPYSDAALSIPKHEGVFILYTSHSLSEGFGFKISPKAGLLDVQLFWDRSKK